MTMTAGERMVWATEFTRAMAAHSVTSESTLIVAVDRATGLVQDLRYLAKTDRNRKESWLDTGSVEMLADMLGTGGDR
jgi:hypothetical protein